MTVTACFTFDAGHRVHRRRSRCRHVHGHRFTFEVEVRPSPDWELGAFKERAAAWFDQTFDHGFVVEAGDPLEDWLRANDQKTTVLDCAPTIENLVEVVFKGLSALLERADVVRVSGSATPDVSVTIEAVGA